MTRVLSFDPKPHDLEHLVQGLHALIPQSLAQGLEVQPADSTSAGHNFPPYLVAVAIFLLRVFSPGPQELSHFDQAPHFVT